MILLEVRDKVKLALEEVIKNDCYLLEIGINERSLTHRLAVYLEKYFPNYHVDCEYNRKGMDPKKLENYKKNIESDDTEAVTVYPDIIIHKRGTKNNLVVIEAKKSSNTDETDKEKLKLYKKDDALSYKYAFFIKFPVSGCVSLVNIEDLIEEI